MYRALIRTEQIEYQSLKKRTTETFSHSGLIRGLLFGIGLIGVTLPQV